MNTEEKVQSLRTEAMIQRSRFSRFLLAEELSMAADLIESQQARIAELKA